MTALQRGRVYWAVLDEEVGRKPYLVVSNNRRNRNLSSVLAVRITTSHKPDIPSVVTLGPGDPLVGSVLCDEVGPLWEDELQADAGALSPGTMRAVEAGLHDALGLMN
jgi:mRNA interferase MazF